MVIYNITLIIEEDIREEWLEWMQATHIPNVMATGKFMGYNMLYLLDSPNEGHSYCMQYKARSLEDYNAYVAGHAAGLQAELAEKFGNRYVAFRTLMEVIAEE